MDVPGQAGTALARLSQDNCSFPLKKRSPEGLGAGPAPDPGGTQGKALSGGNPEGGDGPSPRRGSRVPSPGALSGL